jgi:uncharacterized protein YggE
MEQIAEITVKGYGNISAMPDGIHIDMEVLSQKTDYPKTLEHLHAKVSAINAALVRAGCTEAATTKSYGVSELWSDQYDADKRKFIGYQATQKMGVTIPVDRAILGTVFAEITATDSKPEIGITFVVRDKDAMEKGARINAVTKAKEAAQDLATASDLKLMAVKSINFTGSRSSGGAGLSFAQYDVAPPPEITPDVISHEESVTMVWLAEPCTSL